MLVSCWLLTAEPASRAIQEVRQGSEDGRWYKRRDRYRSFHLQIMRTPQPWKAPRCIRRFRPRHKRDNVGAHPNNRPRREDEARSSVFHRSIDRPPKAGKGREERGFPFVLLFCLVLCVERRSTDDDDDKRTFQRTPAMSQSLGDPKGMCSSTGV